MKKLIVATLFAGVFYSCGNSGKQEETKNENEETTIRIDGSSTVHPITEAVAEDFRATHPEVQITIGTSGTGGGMKKFTNGEIDICNASRPIKKEEADACAVKSIQFIELPVAYDGIAIVVNPKNTWVDKLTTAELKTIWESAAQGKITNWNQVRPGFPDKEITLFGPGTDSGTFDYFCEAINKKKADSRGDYTASEDDNVLVQGVASDEGALGYFGLAYFEENRDKLKLVPIDDGDDANGTGAVLPSTETVQNGTYAPLSRVLLVYFNKGSLADSEIKEFGSFYIKEAGKLSAEVGYIPLQSDLYTVVADRLNNEVTGTLYENGEAGTNLEELLKASAQ